MIQIGLKLRFQDGYDMAVANGVVQYARTKFDWQVRGQGPWFFSLDKEALLSCDALIARIEDDEDARFCASLGIPVVDIAGATSLKLFSQVRNDDYQTGVSAGVYLKKLGSQHLAWCGVEQVHWARERFIGFCSATSSSPEVMPSFSRSLSWWRHLYDSDEDLEAWLTELPKPCSIFCCNDLSAMKVELVCQRLGIAIPEEIMVLGVDNETLLCELASPSISSIQPDCETIGYQASAMLDSLLNDKVSGVHIRRIAPGPVMERESTRLFFCEDEQVAKAMQLIKAEATGGLQASEVARQATICRRSLEMRFRSVRGTTIWEEITAEKLSRAALLLTHSKESITSIAQQCGFSSIHRFYSLFKRKHHMTPQQYREKKLSD
ncbi:MAG: DNA-binding transcriptional regulator [Sphaerochaeta sp.]|nr:DNA-binding transcriptional regulator [Sphaerochaeta sp.]MDD4301219.1 DNA-binding transcriptional regulator [Sphaerochaeta sp.]MDY0243947.1 DNA-binding transcriptional regulator [Sphaerochaeta sp.]